jgi:hypothetical protein
VADNNSTDNSIEFIKKNFPEIKIIQNQSNGGFAKGYNEALSQIKADYFVLLNSDVEVTNHWLTPIISAMENDKTIAACQPKILSYNEKNKFEYAGAAGGFIDKWAYPFCRGRIFDTIEEDHQQYNYLSEIFWASGAALFIRASSFFEVKGFDEMFFSHMEEIDLCWRLKNRGYKIMFIPQSLIYHVGGATLSAYNPYKTFLNFRNNLFLIVKNQFNQNLVISLMRRLVLDGLAGIKFILDKKPKHTLAIIKAHVAFYKLFFVFLSKRKKERLSCKNPNLSGIYPRWIVWQYFVLKRKTFNQLPEKMI